MVYHRQQPQPLCSTVARNFTQRRGRRPNPRAEGPKKSPERIGGACHRQQPQPQCRRRPPLSFPPHKQKSPPIHSTDEANGRIRRPKARKAPSALAVFTPPTAAAPMPNGHPPLSFPTHNPISPPIYSADEAEGRNPKGVGRMGRKELGAGVVRGEPP